MEFSIPTNWDSEIISGLVSLDKNTEVVEIYGKLASDEIGGGRTSSSLAFVTRNQAKRHINEAHKAGFKFNYLLNALCIDNLEFTRKGQKMISGLMDWVIKSGTDSVTVSNPYLAMWIKRNYPLVKIDVSAMANVDSPIRAKFWEDLGVNKITFPGQMVNRNYQLIGNIRKAIRCKMQLVANNGCLLNCPTYINHALMNSHASQSWHKCKGFVFDHHIIMCRANRLSNTTNLIRADWIRPEDVGFYKELGIDSIKLVDRRLPVDKILFIADVYLKRSYNGNLLDLFHTFQDKTYNAHKGWLGRMIYMFNPFTMNIFRVLSLSGLLSKLDIYIDNKKLDGFIENIPVGCNPDSCDACGYCGSIAEKEVKISAGYREEILSQYKKALNLLWRDGLTFPFFKKHR